MARILLVEDDADVRAVIRQALADQGHRVDDAAGCTAAAVALGATQHDLLITNVLLPDGDGRQLARVAAASGVPALFITGDFAHMTALEAEGACLLRKPFRLRELHDTLAAMGIGAD